MGTCIACIIQKYGPQLATLISLQKVEEFLEIKMKEVKEVIQQNVEKMQTGFKAIFFKEKTKVAEIFAKVKSDVGENKLQKLAQKQGKTVDETIGITKANEQFQKIQDNFNNQISTQKGGIMDQISNRYQEFKESIEKEKPTVPIYSQLSDDKRKDVVQKIQDKYGPEMKEKQQKFTNSISQAMNPEVFQNALKGLDPSKQLKQIGNTAQGTAKAVKFASGGGLKCF